jgi:hypothetical protein
MRRSRPISALLLFLLAGTAFPADRVRIRVVDARTGEPIAGARVTTARRQRGRDLVERFSDYRYHETNAEGHVDVGPLPERGISVKAHHAGYVEHDFTPLLPREEAGVGLAQTLRLIPGLPIAGRVLLPDGSPLPKGTVSVDRWGKPLYGQVTGKGVQVREDGSFQLPPLPEGAYRLRVSERLGTVEYRGERTVAAGDRGVVLKLVKAPRAAAGGSLVIRVTDGKGRPPTRGSFRVTGTARTIAGVLTSGEVRLDVSGGTGALWVEVFGAVAPGGARLGAVLRGPVPARPDVLEIRLPPERTIHGVVLDADGVPIAGAEVVARLDTPETDRFPGLPLAHDETASGPDGAFSLRGLGDYVYEVVAEVEGKSVGSARVRTGADTVTLRPRRLPDRPPPPHGKPRVPPNPRNTVQVLVANWPEGERGKARIAREGRIGGAGVVSKSTLIDEGRVVFDELEPRLTYAVYIGPVGDGLMAYVEGVEPGPTPLLVKLRKGGRVTGRLLFPSGAHGLRVRTRWRGFDLDASVGADGVFALAGLPDGEWTLTAGGYHGDRLLVGEAAARTGESTVIELRFDASDIRNLELPPDAGEEEVNAYIRAVLTAKGSWITGTYREKKLLAIGSRNAPILLRHGRTLAGTVLVNALAKLVSEEHKALVLRELPRRMWLAKVVVAKGWAADAREILLAGLADPTLVLPTEWVDALASLRDPKTYGLLVRYFVEGHNRFHTHRSIRDLPGIDLADSFAPAWQRAKAEGSWEAANFAPVAAENGVLDALAYVVAQVGTKSARLGFVPNASAIARRLLGFDRTDEELVTWFAAHRDRLVFDPAAGVYELR